MVIVLVAEDMEIGAVINGVRIGNLHFADDSAALAENEEDFEISVDGTAEVNKKMGMLINSEKMEIQHLRKGKRDIQIRIDGKATDAD